MKLYISITLLLVALAMASCSSTEPVDQLDVIIDQTIIKAIQEENQNK